MVHRSEPTLPTAAISETVGSEELGPWFQGALGRARATLARRATPYGRPGGVVANDFRPRAGQITFSFPSQSDDAVGRVEPNAARRRTGDHCARRPPRRHRPVVRRARRPTWPTALGVDGPIRERYLVGRHDTDVERAVAHRIGWPIFHTGPMA